MGLDSVALFDNDLGLGGSEGMQIDVDMLAA